MVLDTPSTNLLCASMQNIHTSLQNLCECRLKEDLQTAAVTVSWEIQHVCQLLDIADS